MPLGDNGGKHKSKSQRHHARMEKAERDNSALEASQSSLQSWADEMNDLAERSSNHSSPVAHQTSASPLQCVGVDDTMDASEGPDDISPFRTGFITPYPLILEQTQATPAVTMPAGVHPVWQNLPGEGFVFARQVYDVDAAVAASRGYVSNSSTTAPLAPPSYVDQLQAQSFPSISHMNDGTEAHSRVYSAFQFDRRTPTSRPQSDSTQRYLSSSGLCRPTNYQQQQQQNYDAQPTLANSLASQYSISRQSHIATVLEQDDSLQSTNSIAAPVPELFPSPPTSFAQQYQQRGDPAADILDAVIESSFGARLWAARSSYKNHSSSSPGPPSLSNPLQSQKEGDEKTHSHFVGAPAHSQDPIADFEVPIVGQSRAEAQLEVTSRFPIIDSFDLSRYKTSSAAPLCPLPSNRSEDPKKHLEGTRKHQLDIASNVESRDVKERVDDSGPSSPIPSLPASTSSLITIGSSLWHHAVTVHPPPLDLSESSSQLAQFEHYIKTFIDPQVTKYIMVNTPIYLPSFSSVSTLPIMSKEVLRPLTPSYCQEYTYLVLRLEGIIKDLQGLSVNQLYWKLKRQRLVKDVRASHEWLRKKVQERIQGESEALRKRQTELEDRILGSSDGSNDGKEDRHRRDSDDSNTTSSSMALATVRTVEGGVNAIFAQDDDEERATFQRWDDDELAEQERSAAMEQPQTTIQHIAGQRQSAEKSLERYIAAGDMPVPDAFLTPPKTPTATNRQTTPMRPPLKPGASTDRLRRVGWVGKERHADENHDDPSPETPVRRGTVALLSSGSKGGFTGSPYERTWTRQRAASKTDAEMDPPLEAGADVFFEAAAANIPICGPRARNNTTAAVSSENFAGSERTDAQEGGALRESTHPYIFKTPPKSSDARAQQFYAALAVRGIRFGGVGRGLAPTTSNSLQRQPTLIAVPSRESLDCARARSSIMADMRREATTGGLIGAREERDVQTPPALTFGPPRRLRRRNYLVGQNDVGINMAHVPETVFDAALAGAMGQNYSNHPSNNIGKSGTRPQRTYQQRKARTIANKYPIVTGGENWFGMRDCRYGLISRW